MHMIKQKILYELCRNSDRHYDLTAQMCCSLWEVPLSEWYQKESMFCFHYWISNTDQNHQVCVQTCSIGYKHILCPQLKAFLVGLSGCNMGCTVVGHKASLCSLLSFTGSCVFGGDRLCVFDHMLSIIYSFGRLE